MIAFIITIIIITIIIICSRSSRSSSTCSSSSSSSSIGLVKDEYLMTILGHFFLISPEKPNIVGALCKKRGEADKMMQLHRMTVAICVTWLNLDTG